MMNQVQLTSTQKTATRGSALSERASLRLLHQLEERKRDLHERIAAERDRIEVEGLSQLEGSVGDDVDRAFVTSHIGHERDVIDRYRMQLNEIAAATERYAAGDIGICSDCGERIEYKRLTINPVASRCTECQERAEQTARMA